jgi:hypothetical protein
MDIGYRNHFLSVPTRLREACHVSYTRVGITLDKAPPFSSEDDDPPTILLHPTSTLLSSPKTHLSQLKMLGGLSVWCIAYLLFPSLVLLHLSISPYTKVEESFNIQAVHDILEYGVPTHDNVNLRFKTLYDHMTFPGAVPRTFIGALVLSSVAKPLVWYGHLTGEQQQFLGE